jgi:GDPmannose 4,6-dehydratase
MLFNHESPLRPDRFVTQKIVKAAARIAAGSSERLQLGNIDVERDWGWAPEYVEAMWAMLRLPTPEDFVIATGRSVSLAYFVARVFEFFSLDWSAHVERNTQLLRPADISSGKANPAKARELLGWRARKTVDDVVVGMCSAASGR